jgi:hypothetical protein
MTFGKTIGALCVLALLAGETLRLRADDEKRAALGVLPGDVDGDADVDLIDYQAFPDCMLGPGAGFPVPACASINFADPPPTDNDVDLRDFRGFSNAFDPPPRPPGDDCANAVPIGGEGVFAFDNTNATLDGLPHAGCAFNKHDQIENDIWYCWQAECNGMIVVETCNQPTSVDTKIALYEGCDCPAPSQRLVGCDDDACGVQSRVTFETQVAEAFLVRIGNFPMNPPGGGSFRVSCGFDACPGGGSCFEDNGTPGCTNADCCNTVCAVDLLCCESAWDGFCAAEAEGLCLEDGFAVCGSPISGSCRSATFTQGCNDEACCDAVCSVDPECCVGQAGWDNVCVGMEASICRGACDTSTESCFTEHLTAGCNNPACCAEVCPRDPSCCQAAWDSACVDKANQFCD